MLTMTRSRRFRPTLDCLPTRLALSGAGDAVSTPMDPTLVGWDSAQSGAGAPAWYDDACEMGDTLLVNAPAPTDPDTSGPALTQ